MCAAHIRVLSICLHALVVYVRVCMHMLVACAQILYKIGPTIFQIYPAVILMEQFYVTCVNTHTHTNGHRLYASIIHENYSFSFCLLIDLFYLTFSIIYLCLFKGIGNRLLFKKEMTFFCI